MTIRRSSPLLAFRKSAASWANSGLLTILSIDMMVRMSSPSGPAGDSCLAEAGLGFPDSLLSRFRYGPRGCSGPCVGGGRELPFITGWMTLAIAVNAFWDVTRVFGAFALFCRVRFAAFNTAGLCVAVLRAGQTRVVGVKTNSGVLRRPATRIIALQTDGEVLAAGALTGGGMLPADNAGLT
ncbi:hypothetical protein EVAR_96323_1 [Eumeta japonica]|uniref:Uncharacterized protein n=1 Tax=Eumeta variegata TaxID=151549 RepID=A0A4C1VW89_EUMVA|nr:hypothetical protein EVAR_96323_1 [Eumeta japonica]